MQNQFPIPPDIVIEASRNERARLVGAREQAIKMAATPFDQKIRALDAYLDAVGSMLPTATGGTELFEGDDAAEEGASSISAQIKEAAKALIVAGKYVTTQEIYDFMVKSGSEFPATGKEPLPRITKIVSSTGLYKGNKSRGWSLRGDPLTDHESEI